MHGDFVARRVASCLITGESSRKQLATKSVPILQVSLSNKSSYPTKEGCFGDFGTHTDVWIQFASLLRFLGSPASWYIFLGLPCLCKQMVRFMILGHLVLLVYRCVSVIRRVYEVRPLTLAATQLEITPCRPV